MKPIFRIFLATAFAASTVPALAGQYKSDDGRLLASNCFQCHGVDGKPVKGGFEGLAGSNEVFGELNELAGGGEGEREEELMAVHAKAFAGLKGKADAKAEMKALSDYFAALPRTGNGEGERGEEDEDDDD